MSRVTPYLGIVAALALGAFVVAFLGSATVSRAPTEITPLASSTLSTLPLRTLPALEPQITPTTTATQAPAPKNIATPAPATIVPETKPASVSPLQPALSQTAALEISASLLRAALVNILCRVSIDGNLRNRRLVSGSGVFIDPKGIILTNAHIAEYFLLADRGTSCVIRSGSPAIDQYKAAPIFISLAWIHENPDVIGQTAPTGTGAHDFALLAVTETTNGSALPSSFPSVPLATEPLLPSAPIVIGSYGAQFLNQNQLQTALYPTIVLGSVKDVFTFGTNTIDVLALGGSDAAQEGSSGGGTTDISGALTSTITTSTVEGATSTRSLYAITASYIRADYASETGWPLDLLLALPTKTSVMNFTAHIPELLQIITAHL